MLPFRPCPFPLRLKPKQASSADVMAEDCSIYSPGGAGIFSSLDDLLLDPSSTMMVSVDLVLISAYRVVIMSVVMRDSWQYQ
jgi:hypothetical protein